MTAVGYLPQPEIAESMQAIAGDMMSKAVAGTYESRQLCGPRQFAAEASPYCSITLLR